MVRNLIIKDTPYLKRLLISEGLYKMHTIDALQGEVKSVLESNNYYRVTIGRLRFGIDSGVDSINTWTHEFTEASLTYLLTDMVIENGATFDQLRKSVIPSSYGS